jgi:cytochrome P450
MFQPERWISIEGGDSERQRINPTGGASSNYDFLTFLQGGRNSIGQGFARAELRCLLAVMAMKFEWSLDMKEKDVTLGGSISIRPQHGLYL